VRTANGFAGAAAVAVLLVHFDGYGGAGSDGTFAGYAFGAAGVAADVVGGYALSGLSIMGEEMVKRRRTVTGELET
jgi:hypothetical protein